MPVSIHELPLFKELETSDHWYGYLAQMIDAEFAWVKAQKNTLSLPPQLRPYFDTALYLWQTAVVVAGNGAQHFAAYGLRAILERVALLWTIHPDVTLEPQILVTQFENNDRKIRMIASNEVFDAAGTKDYSLKEIYDILSRYFGHISHLDRVPISFDDQKDKLLAIRSRTIPLFLLFDVGHCVANLVGRLLEVQGIAPPAIVSGRSQKVNPYKFMRLAAYIMCERHTVKKGASLGILYKDVKDVVGDVGITEFYRGGMELYRYGSADDEKPTHDALAEFSIFVIGRVNKDQIKVKLEREAPKGEKYRISWPKTFEIDGSTLAIKASDNTDPVPFFDYVTEFVNVVKAHENFKAAQEAAIT